MLQKAAMIAFCMRIYPSFITYYLSLEYDFIVVRPMFLPIRMHY